MANTKHIRMIEAEFASACEKHPKFCNELCEKKFDWKFYEKDIKIFNAHGPYYGESILQEEIAEAMNAHQQGDREHCLQELAQCGAVILRMMQFVEEERWAHGETFKKDGK